MKIKFTHDFRGKATGEKFYLGGAELDVDEDVANELIALNHAVAVVVKKPKPEPGQANFSEPSRAELLKDARTMGVTVKAKATKKEILTLLADAHRNAVDDES